MEDELFKEIISFENLYEATMEVSRGKWRKAEWVKWYLDLEANLINLQNKLIWDLWEPHPTVDFFVLEPKKRPVARPHIEDRIIGHAIMRKCLPFFEKHSSPQSYACRTGKGSFNAVLEWQRIIRSAIGRWGFDWYVICIDFAHDYQSVDLENLKRLYRRIIPSEKTCILLDKKIDSYPNLQGGNFLFKHEGLALGNIENQHLANLKSGIVDFFVTDTLGLGRMYVRYMDDIRIAVHTKEEAQDVLARIDELVEGKLSQSIGGKKTYYKRFKGKDELCGYVVCPHHLEMQSEKIRRRLRGLRKVRQGWLSGYYDTKRYEATLCNVIDYLDKTNSTHEFVKYCIDELGMKGKKNKGVRRYLKRCATD